jgi:Rrf2 family protein
MTCGPPLLDIGSRHAALEAAGSLGAIRSGDPPVRSPKMISITSKSPYAVLALAELGRNAGSDPVPIGELARKRDVPVQFLEQLFAVLRRAGVISSQRGVKGGYRFARAPATVTVLEIVELLDGPLGRDAQGIFADAAEAARRVLEQTTIADVIEREATDAGASMYHI